MNWPIEWDHFTFRLQYKHSGTFANRKYDEQSYNQKSENVWPHSSNSIENATPLSRGGTLHMKGVGMLVGNFELNP